MYVCSARLTDKAHARHLNAKLIYFNNASNTIKAGALWMYFNKNSMGFQVAFLSTSLHTKLYTVINFGLQNEACQSREDNYKKYKKM